MEFQNAENAAPPGHVPHVLVGGESTEYWVFDTLGVGTTELTFELLPPARSAVPADTKRFTVSIVPCGATPGP